MAPGRKVLSQPFIDYKITMQNTPVKQRSSVHSQAVLLLKVNIP